MGHLLIRRFGEPARTALIKALDAVRGQDQLAPVVVAVPTALAG